MQSLKKISLKTRLFFLIGISVISFSGIMLPYLFQLKNKCNLYKIKLEGTAFSEEIQKLIYYLMEKKEKAVRKTVLEIDSQIKKLTADINIKEDWDNIKSYFLNFVPSFKKRDYKIVISELIKLDFIVYENTGAVLDDNLAIKNIFVAHYFIFPQLIFQYFGTGKISSALVFDFIKHYKLAAVSNPEFMFIKTLLQSINTSEILPIILLEKEVFKWLKNYYLNKFNFYKTLFYFSLLFTFLGLGLIGIIVFSVMRSIKKGITTLNTMAEKLEKGDFSSLGLEEEEFSDDCGQALLRLEKAIVSQREVSKKLADVIHSIARGYTPEIKTKEFTGIWHPLAISLKEVIKNIKQLKEGINSLGKSFTVGGYPIEEVEINWKTYLYPLVETAEYLENINKELVFLIRNISRGAFEVEKFKKTSPKGLYRDIYESIEILVKEFKEILNEMNKISFSIETGQIDVEIESERFKGSFKELVEFVNRIIRKMKEQVRQVKELLEEEEELLKFKRTVEEDEELETIYKRIINLLIIKFGIKNFAFYEVFEKSNTMSVLVASQKETFCDPAIFNDAELCRAKRRGLPVKSEEGILGKACSMYRGQTNYYMCYPFFFTEGVKFILQIVCDNQEEYERLKEKKSTIIRYMESIVPFLHIKKEMFKHKSCFEER